MLMGQELYQTESGSRDMAALAPKAELVTAWKEDGQATAQRLRQFLMAHTKA